MTSLQTFIADQYQTELSAFHTALDGVPDETFTTAKLGHAPAWHALHIAEYLRLFYLLDKSASYAHLGWEDSAWTQPLAGTPKLTETAGKAEILAHLDEVSAQAVAAIRALSDTELEGMAYAPSAPTGERPRLAALGLHLRHIAYHRGQVQLAKKA